MKVFLEDFGIALLAMCIKRLIQRTNYISDNQFSDFTEEIIQVRSRDNTISRITTNRSVMFHLSYKYQMSNLYFGTSTNESSSMLPDVHKKIQSFNLLITSITQDQLNESQVMRFIFYCLMAQNENVPNISHETL